MVALLAASYTNAQIKNAKTETVKVYGNCSMCETTIEKAAAKKKVSVVNWNQDTKMATITYNSKKTTHCFSYNRFITGTDPAQPFCLAIERNIECTGDICLRFF